MLFLGAVHPLETVPPSLELARLGSLATEPKGSTCLPLQQQDFKYVPLLHGFLMWVPEIELRSLCMTYPPARD